MPKLAIRARATSLRRRAAVERDLRAFERRYGPILRPTPKPSRGVALLASLTHSPFQLKLEGMLAKALQFRGLDIVAAVPEVGELPRRYLELFGIRRFVRLDEFLGPDGIARAEREAQRALAAEPTTREVKELTFRGAEVGRQALSTLSRHLHEGAVDSTTPEARALLSSFLAMAIRTALAADALLEHLKPELVVFNERNYAAEGPLSDLALERALNVIQFVSGFEDEALVFKRYTRETKGLHPRSISDESWPLVETLEWDEAKDAELDAEFAHRYDGTTFLARWNQGGTQKSSREEIVERLDLDPARKTAVVFSHILWDANMFYGRDLFADQEEWFVETLRAACANDRVNWIVKLHPANVWKLRRDGFDGELDEYDAIRTRVGPLPLHVHVLPPDTEVSTFSLFGVTDFGVTIRGSVGFELPCLGVPVLTAGTGFYSGRGFTVDSSSAEQYIGRLHRIEQLPPPSVEQVSLARKHAYALFRLRQTRFSSFRAVYRDVEEISNSHPFEATVELTASSADELTLAEDLRRFGEWAADSRALDYLAV